jgi:Protein of unknown function, DUF547
MDLWCYIGMYLFTKHFFYWQVSLPYPEPLIHFALVNGTRSGPTHKCYSPGNIDKELMEAARDFIRNGGLIVNATAKVASANKILHW